MTPTELAKELRKLVNLNSSNAIAVHDLIHAADILIEQAERITELTIEPPTIKEEL